MSPLLEDGDVIEVQRVPAGQLYVGDIVLFRSKEGEFLVHRCVKRQSASGQIWVTTKGDAGRGLDRPITVDEVLGRVIRIHRRGRVRFELGGWLRFMNYVLAKWSLYRLGLIRVKESIRTVYHRAARSVWRRH